MIFFTAIWGIAAVNVVFAAAHGTLRDLVICGAVFGFLTGGLWCEVRRFRGHFQRVFCPNCHDENFFVRADRSGSYDSDYGTAYWFEGSGRCRTCGHRGPYFDTTV